MKRNIRSNILQFKITLCKTKPAIWRQFVIEDTLTFHDLHLVVQVVMGWKNSHLHQFVYEGKSYIGIPEYLKDGDNFEVIDSRQFLLSEFFDKSGMKILYEYDFGDGWFHELTLEKVYKSGGLLYPICEAGEHSCPPEDCGGISGYYNMLEILNDKKHPEHKVTRIWAGAKYNADFFDMDKVNKNLKRYEDFDEEVD